MNKTTRVVAIAAAMAALAVIVFILFAGDQSDQTSVLPLPTDQVKPQPGVPPDGQKPPETTPAGTVTIFRVNDGDENTEPHLVQATVPVPAGEEPMTFALNAMAQDKASPLPTATRALSVKVTGGTARVDFNKAFGGPADGGNFNGGSLEESLVLNAVLKTMAQFPEVKQVQVVVEGKPIESVGGHFDWSKPMSVSGDAARTAQGEEQ